MRSMHGLLKMVELRLVSESRLPLRPLVESALANELRLLDAGIRLTEQRLREFEAKYRLPTAEFINRFEDNQLPETLEFAEWIGEYRLLERQQQKADALRGIQFAD